VAPGFLLLLTVVFLAALCPVVAASGIGLLFFDSTRIYGLRLLQSGIAGGAIVFFLFLVRTIILHKKIALPSSDELLLSSAVFTCAASAGAIFLFVKHKQKQGQAE